MSRWSAKTMEAIEILSCSVDGAWRSTLKRHNGQPPTGRKQAYEGETVAGIAHEWVDQSGGGLSGDDFHGTVTFVLGDYHLIVSFHT